MINLLYFGPAIIEANYGTIKTLLANIQNKHGYEFTIETAVGRKRQEELYESYFCSPPTARLLRQRLGVPPNRVFRCNAGKGLAYVRGTLAILNNEGVQWCIGGVHTGDIEIIRFLNSLLNEGENRIKACFQHTTQYVDEEKILRDKFIEAGILDGDYITEASKLRLGNSIKLALPTIHPTEKYPDLICRKVSAITDWVFEVEKRLNYEAIGQVLLYEFLYHLDNPGCLTQKAIICKVANIDFWGACAFNNIEVFLIPGDEVIPIWKYFSASELSAVHIDIAS